MEIHTIQNKYIIQKCIGSGKFGKVYSGIYKKTNEQVAIKFEDNNAPFNILKREANILNMLNSNNCKYVPSVFWFGIYMDMKVLVMTYYNCSLDEYITKKTLSISQLNNIMIQMIQILESIHKHGIIHRDIKPQNFMLKSGEIYLIDFGLSTFYIDSNNVHILDKMNDCIVGTPKYISYNIHCGNTPSRRDDLISIGYLFIYLFNLKLPWENNIIDRENSNINYELTNELTELNTLHFKNIKRKELKSWDYIEPFCKSINYPIYEFLRICYMFEYNEFPNYQYLIEMFYIL
jgi:serine/threonine protein kinase